MKKIMILMLSLAVLFSFAACDNSTSNSGSVDQLNIAYIVGTEKVAKDYLVGEIAKAEDFTFTGYDVAGNVVAQNMEPSLFKEGSALSAASTDASFTYDGLAMSTVSVTAPINVYAIEKITVDASKVNKDYYTIVETGSNGTVPTKLEGLKASTAYAPFGTIDTDGLVVTATYDETKTKPLATDQYEVALGYLDADASNKFVAIENWTVVPTGFASGDKYVVLVSAKGNTSATATYDVNFMTNKVTDIYVKVADNFQLWYDKDGSSADATAALKTAVGTDIVVSGKMLNGQEGYALTGVKYSLSNDPNATFGESSALSIGANVTSVTVYAQWEGTDVAPEAPKVMSAASDPISVTEDYETGITAVEGSTGVKMVIGKDYSKVTSDNAATDADEIVEQLTVKYTWASKKDTTSETALTFHSTDPVGYSLSTELFADTYGPRTDYPVDVVVGNFKTQILVDLVATDPA